MTAVVASAPTRHETVRVFATIGLTSFGGPAAQIALMHRILVDELGWLTEQRFMRALSFCMLLPGPEAMQLATYAGWRLHGAAGGIMAGLLFVLPGALIVFALAVLYLTLGEVPLVAAAFVGIKAAVLGIVLEALVRISRRALTGRLPVAIAVAAFVAISVAEVPFAAIVLAAALAGAVGCGSATDTASEADGAPAIAISRTLRTIALWLVIWLTPLGALAIVLGPDDILTQLGVFFAQLAVVTFGGAYAVLAYMTDVVVAEDWLTTGQMIDGLGLAETTPGPLILVTEFVGTVAASRHGGSMPWTYALGGAVVSLWMTFAPCFLWIFAGAPYVEWITAQRRLRGALAGVMASVVGVIATLSIWFALQVLTPGGRPGLAVPIDTGEWLDAIDWVAAGVAAVSAYALIGRHWPVPQVLALAAMTAVVALWALG